MLTMRYQTLRFTHKSSTRVLYAHQRGIRVSRRARASPMSFFGKLFGGNTSEGDKVRMNYSIIWNISNAHAVRKRCRGRMTTFLLGQGMRGQEQSWHPLKHHQGKKLPHLQAYVYLNGNFDRLWMKCEFGSCRDASGESSWLSRGFQV